ncbi:ECF RNA polymerase sigma factor SigR [compost metagenome]
MQRVNRLPEAQRNTLFLVYVEELSYREAAEVLGVPIGTIMSRLAAARLRLANDSVLQPHIPQSKGERS